jgi:hypothetical protein
VAIGAAGDGPVVLDGTVGVATLARQPAWRPAPQVGPHVFALPLIPGVEVTLGLGHIVALHYRSSASCHIR